MKEPKLFSYSQLNVFNECPRKHFFTYEKRWVPEGSAPALVFGSSWGRAMDVVWQECAGGFDGKPIEMIVEMAMQAFIERYIEGGLPHPMAMDVDTHQDLLPRTPDVAEEMLRNYIEIRREFFNGIELLAVEAPFIIPISQTDPSMLYVGLLDKVLRDHRDGRIYCVDHKTTSAYSKQGYFRSTFAEGFSPNAQMDGYQYALTYKYGKEAKHILIDAALVHKTVHDGFRFFPVDHAAEQLDSWLYDTHRVVEGIQIEYNRYMARPTTGHILTAYPRHTNSCHNYNGCQFLSICKFVGNPSQIPTPPGFSVNTTTTAARLGISEEKLQAAMEVINA